MERNDGKGYAYLILHYCLPFLLLCASKQDKKHISLYLINRFDQTPIGGFDQVAADMILLVEKWCFIYIYIYIYIYILVEFLVEFFIKMLVRFDIYGIWIIWG
jgi:hypothetical protein